MTTSSSLESSHRWLLWLLWIFAIAAFQWLTAPLLARALGFALPRLAPHVALPLALAAFRHFFPRLLWGGFALFAYRAATRRPPVHPSRRFLMVLEPASLALLSFLVFSSALDSPVALYDEGLSLTGAWCVSLGALPYRDFCTIYGPAQTTMLGVLFAIFGKSLLLARLVDLAFRVGASLLVWSIIRPLVRPLPRLLGVVSFALWLSCMGCSLAPVIPFLFFSLLAIRLLLAVPPASHPFRPCFRAGFAMGAAMLFRHDLAAVASTAFGLLLCVPAFQPSRCLRSWKAPLAFCLAILPLPFLAYGLLALAVPFPDLWQQLVSMPLFVFPAYRSLPYPSFRDFAAHPFVLSPVFLLPALLLALPVAISVLAVRRRSLPRRTRPVALLAAFSAAMFPYALGRSDFTHLVFFALPAIPLLFALVPPSRRGCAVAVLLAAWAIAWEQSVAFGFATRWQQATDQQRTLSELRAALSRRPPGPVFVGEATHDRLVANAAAFYILLDRLPATKYVSFEPGVVTTPEVQEEIIRELRAADVQTVILHTDPPDIEPNRSAEDSQARRLDPFLRQNFVPVAHVPPFLVCARQASGQE